MKVNHTRGTKAKKGTPEDPIFYTVHSKMKLPKSILHKLRAIKRGAKGKIPVLIIHDREQEMKVLLKPFTLVEERIKKLQGIDLISLALTHLLTCRRRYL